MTTWLELISEIDTRAATRLPAGMRAAVRAVLPFGDDGLTALLSCGTPSQLERGEGDDHCLGAVASAPSSDAAIDVFGPAEDSELVTLGAILSGTYPLPLSSRGTVRKAVIRSWRPRRRAQIELAVSEPPVVWFLKLERPAKAVRWGRIRHVLAQELEKSPVIAMAEPDGADSERGLSLAKHVFGVPLAEHLARADAAAVLYQVGRGLRDLEPLASHVPLAALLPPYDFAAAAADLGRFIRLLSRLATPGADVLAAGAERLAALGHVDSGRRALIHRDLHDGQMVVTGHRITLLDLEGSSFGDPALDFGNLLAQLRLRHLQGRLADSRARLGEALLAGHGDLESADWLRTVRAYEVLSLFRLAAVYDLRPRWRQLGSELARSGHALLAEIESPAINASAFA